MAKNQAVYIGKNQDQIDLGLAEFVNKYPEREKLKIMFIRESEGVYKFGSKKIYIKVEKGFEDHMSIISCSYLTRECAPRASGRSCSRSTN